MNVQAARVAGAPVLEVRNLRHQYGTGTSAHVAIEGMSFSVADQEFVSIVGPSGCGKTTLLRCVSGLMRPTEGEVRINGREVEQVPSDLGIVFQDYSRSLFPWHTVAGNVAFPLSGRSRRERKALVEESLAAVGLDAFADRYPWQLSGGMQQRVAIARAIAYRPDILLMDEPFASVDAQTRATLEDLVLALRDRFRMTILFVTHDIDESVYVGDRVLILKKSPSRVVEEIPVALGARDQIATKENPEFIRLRSEVARRIYDQSARAESADHQNTIPISGTTGGAQ